MKVKLLSIPLIILCFNALVEGQCLTGMVHITGEMRNVMWKGKLEGNIYLDTISNKSNIVISFLLFQFRSEPGMRRVFIRYYLYILVYVS